MRPSMLETGLECLVHNINRKNHNLRLFEFGKTYHTSGVGQYEEKEKLCLYITGMTKEASWKTKEDKSDFYYLKGITESILQAAGLTLYKVQPVTVNYLQYGIQVIIDNDIIITLGLADASAVKRFDIKQQVWYAELEWEKVSDYASRQKSGYTEITKFPAVQRDLAIVVDKQLAYEKVEQAVKNTGIQKLQSIKLFDVFESDKLDAGKKSFAVNFTFLDKEKTLTDTEIDSMMQKIMHTFEQELSAEIRK